MATKWRKVKLAIGINMCILPPPRTIDRSLSSETIVSPASSAAASFSDARRPSTPTPSSAGNGLSKSGSKSKSSSSK
ncbi:hypothetical protein PIB30_048416, partial [Stylosanthes scabra]|nr:hypothetical protein [Stylosanthes scabra]